MSAFNNLTDKLKKAVDKYDLLLDKVGDRLKKINYDNVVLAAIVLVALAIGIGIGVLL